MTIEEAARSLFDNRMGLGSGHGIVHEPWAPRQFWADLGEALYGPDDPRVGELREPEEDDDLWRG